MAEVNNPCADLAEGCPEGQIRDPETGNCVPNPPAPAPEDCPAGQQRNPDTGECEPIGPGPGEPDAVEPEPIVEAPPYPAPFIPISNGENNAGAIILTGQESESSAIPPKFLTGTRQVTVFTSGCFLTDEIDWREIMYNGSHPLVRFNTSGDETSGISNTKKRPPNHGAHWIKQMRREEENSETYGTADPFRWTMFNFWIFNPKVGREGFVNRVTGGALNAIATPDQDIGIQGDAGNLKIIQDAFTNGDAPVFKYGNVLKFRPISNSPAGSYNGYRLLTEFDDSTVKKYGCPIVRENFRFGLYNGVTDEFVYENENSMRQFLNIYAPKAIKDWPGNTTKRKIEFYKRILFFGKKSGNWWNFFDEAPASTKEYYEKGIFPHQSFEWSDQDHPKYGYMRYRDYTFDAPGAFTKEELEGMILAPLHSAEITKKIGNVDTVNQKGYTSELQVPNIYFYYNALELEKDFKNKTKPKDEKSPANLASDYILKRYKMAPQAPPEDDEEDERFVVTGEVLKFTSDRVEKLEKINDFMKAYAENYVEINIGTVQGGPVQAIINENNMDRLLLETLYPRKTEDNNSTFEMHHRTQKQRYRRILPPREVIDSWTGNEEVTAHINPRVSMVLDDSFQGIKYSDRADSAGANVTLNDKASGGVQIKIVDWFFKYILGATVDERVKDVQKTNPMEWPMLYYGWDNMQLLRFEEMIRSQITRSKIDEFIARGSVPTKFIGGGDDTRENPFGGIFRPMADVYTGKKAYAEVVGYCIRKYEVMESGEENLIQTFALMDSNNIKEINFVDSQVLPFKKYRYSINTINFVVGTEYDYSFITSKGPSQTITTYSKPGLYFIEAPFFEKIIETRDMPPMTPQVNWLPYQGVDDKIGILLTTDYGEIEEPWLFHNQPYSEGLKKSLASKYGMNKKGLIKWKTDSMPDAFDIFRLENPPESYEWFHGNTSERYVGPKRGARMWKRIASYGKVGFFLDTIEPNKYYYYMFRAIDNYDFENPDSNKIMRSNPTEVFRVRMVSYENGIFLEMEPYEMFIKEEDEILNVERLLKISPSFDQKLIDFSTELYRIGPNLKIVENSLNSVRKDLGLFEGYKNAADSFLFQKNAPPANHLKLGTRTDEKEILWNKKFKIRIKSKSSGKAVDVNVKFVQSNNTLTKEE